jgi:chromosome segregation ATPase
MFIFCIVGKSNFTDAIGFVMGAGLDVLRASNFVTLIHGGNLKRPLLIGKHDVNYHDSI